MNAELHLRFRVRDAAMRELVDRYCERARAYRNVRVFEHGATAAPPAAGPRVWRVLCASGGETWDTADFAAHWRRREQEGATAAQFLVGGPDGWPQAQAQSTLSFGRLTMPHQLAAVVLAEQIYRVLTVLAGHPYHCGHEAVA